MVGFSYVVQTAQLNPIVEITKEVRQCFDNKPTKTAKTLSSIGAKIQIRNESIYKPIRSKRAWKLKYDRHEHQNTRGFFSPIAKSYETFGELELDLRELVLKTLSLGATTPQEPTETAKLSLWERLRNKAPENYIKFDDESNRSAKGKEQCYTNKSMTSTIGERLALMTTRLAAVRAGQSYECCLRLENRKRMLEILEEQRLEAQLTLNTPLGPPYTRKKSLNASRKSVLHSRKSATNCKDAAGREDARKLNSSALQEYHKRKCRDFVATLKALHSLICCVYHLKTRDLRTRVPLSRDYLKVINIDVPLDVKGKPIRHQRVTTTAQNTEGSTDSFHIRDSDRVTSTIPNESFPNVSRPSAIECGSNLEKPSTGFAAKRLKNIMGRPGTLEDIPEPGSAPSGQDNTSSKSGVSRCSLQGTLLSVCTVKRRGQFLGMITNTGNNSELASGQVLTIWQQVATNERSEKRLKPGTMSRKSEKPRGLNLEQLKYEYIEAQKRCSKRLQDDMKRIEKLEKPIFRTKLEALKLSHLIEHDMTSMRRATNKLQQDYHDQNVRPSGWYDSLCERAQELEVEDDDEVNTQLQKFIPFSKDDVETLSHIKSKLCLIIQSLPLYELCKMSTQEALQFFLEKILNSPSNTLSDWMSHRKIKPASATEE